MEDMYRNSLVSLICAFQLSKHPLVPTCSDKWLPTDAQRNNSLSKYTSTCHILLSSEFHCSRRYSPDPSPCVPGPVFKSPPMEQQPKCSLQENVYDHKTLFVSLSYGWFCYLRSSVVKLCKHNACFCMCLSIYLTRKMLHYPGTSPRE